MIVLFYLRYHVLEKKFLFADATTEGEISTTTTISTPTATPAQGKDCCSSF